MKKKKHLASLGQKGGALFSVDESQFAENPLRVYRGGRSSQKPSRQLCEVGEFLLLVAPKEEGIPFDGGKFEILIHFLLLVEDRIRRYGFDSRLWADVALVKICVSEKQGDEITSTLSNIIWLSWAYRIQISGSRIPPDFGF